MKKITLFCIVFVLIISATSCKTADNKSVYNDFISKLKTNQPDIHYSLKDIDGNGIEDLVVINNTTLTIYTFNDKISYIGEHDFLTGTARFFYSDDKDFPGIFVFTASGGMNHFGYMTIKNDEVYLEEIWSEDYSGISDNNNKIIEISDNKKIIKESKKLYEDNKDIVLY